jgi:hypothetical protein
LTTLADTAVAASHEIKDLGQEGEEVGVSATIHYSGGSYDSSSLDEFRRALPNLEKQQGIETVSLHVYNGDLGTTIHASPVRGLKVSAQGTRAALVYGLVTTLKRKLETGVERVQQPPRKPFLDCPRFERQVRA